MRFTRVLVIGVALVLSCALGTADLQSQSASPTISPELRAQLEASIQRGVAYLLKNQKPDGSWDDYPGITALAATAILKQPGNASQKSGPEVKKALAYLVRHGEAGWRHLRQGQPELQHGRVHDGVAGLGQPGVQAPDREGAELHHRHPARQWRWDRAVGQDLRGHRVQQPAASRPAEPPVCARGPQGVRPSGEQPGLEARAAVHSAHAEPHRVQRPVVLAERRRVRVQRGAGVAEHRVRTRTAA